MSTRPFLCFAFCLATSLSLGNTAQAISETAQSDHKPSRPASGGRGALLICGGGTLSPAIKKRFVELAGGPEAKLVIIPSASERDDEASLASKKEYWIQAGIGSAVILHTRDRKVADSAAFVEPLKSATAVWLSGGQQSRLAEIYLATATEKELISRFKNGAVIGGTSAGAAIQSSIMIQSGNPTPVIAKGFDLLPGTIIDQHFLRRNRFNRLLYAIRKNPDRIGVGIAESTAVLFKDQKCEVLGESFVTVVQKTADNKSLSINTYRNGQTFTVKPETESKGLIHRFSFNGRGGAGSRLVDSVGQLHGKIVSHPKSEPLPFHPGSETLVVIPDTEGYCRKRPQIFDSMMQWVADQRKSRNIKYLLHVGDITNDNDELEWKNARKSFGLIDDKVPYVLAAGKP